jgi:hypothetical protein
MRNRVLILVAAALAPFTAVSAQQLTAASPGNVFSIQPLNAMFTAYSAEYERKIGGAATVGVGGTYFNIGDGVDEVSFKSGDVKLRYYPNGSALMGFSFGGTAGFTSVTGTDFNGAEESVSGPTIGILLEYQWLLGVQKNFSVALGAGAKAVFVKDNTITSNDFTTRYPTVRVSVGYAF